MEQYNVTGMSCAACSARVEKAVGKVPGVTACSVSLLTNSMGVEGSAPAEEIIAASGVEVGDNLILLDRYGIQRKLFVDLPHIKEARINPNPPSTLSVEVVETTAVAALPGAGAYWLISRDGKLLEAVDETQAQDYLGIAGLEADAPAASRREPRERVTLAERYAAQVVREERADRLRRQRRLDRLLTSKSTGIPLMLLLFGLVVWLTVAGANGPSALLTALFARVGEGLAAWLAPAPAWLSGILLDGVYRVTAWVVAVMLPPMAIFFPLFTLLEDLGYLPRVAFVMDHAFQKCRACGKQCLTMWMADMSLRYTRQ